MARDFIKICGNYYMIRNITEIDMEKCIIYFNSCDSYSGRSYKKIEDRVQFISDVEKYMKENNNFYIRDE